MRLPLQAKLTAENPLPIVFLTGHGDVPKTVRESRRRRLLTKPVDAPVLLDAVARAIATTQRIAIIRGRQWKCAVATIALRRASATCSLT
jgi:FixJ family two-component response regulator